MHTYPSSSMLQCNNVQDAEGSLRAHKKAISLSFGETPKPAEALKPKAGAKK